MISKPNHWLETSAIVEKEIEPNALRIPLHRFDFENHRKCIAHIDGSHAKILENGDLDEWEEEKQQVSLIVFDQFDEPRFLSFSFRFSLWEDLWRWEFRTCHTADDEPWSWWWWLLRRDIREIEERSADWFHSVLLSSFFSPLFDESHWHRSRPSQVLGSTEQWRTSLIQMNRSVYFSLIV